MSLLAAALALVPSLQAPELGLESFDAAWSAIDEQHFDPTFHGVDWAAVRAELRPRAAAAGNLEELRGVIREMLARLGQSHFQLTPREAMGTGEAGSSASPAGTVGLDLRWMDGAAVVVAVEPEGSADAAGVRPGWRLEGLAGQGLEGVHERAARRAHLRPETAFWKESLLAVDGPLDSSIVLTFRDLAEERRELTLLRRARAGEPFDFPGLPTMFLRARRDIVEHEERSIGVLFFSNWFRPLERELDEALLELRGCDGIVLDLRGNTGGDGTLTTDLAGHFFDEPATLGTMRLRDGVNEFTVRPRRRILGQEVEPFLGPLAILVDETTGSSSEVFTGGMQAAGRARVFGARTSGAALPATLTRLPNGDFLLHAIAEFVTGGRTLEGGGVQPDEPLTPTRADWATGHDRALEAACAWIARESR